MKVMLGRQYVGASSFELIGTQESSEKLQICIYMFVEDYEVVSCNHNNGMCNHMRLGSDEMAHVGRSHQVCSCPLPQW